MELKDKTKNYYKNYKGFKPIEIKAMNYIFGKDENNKCFTKYEFEAISYINLLNKKVVNLCKIIWDNRNSIERLENIAKQLKIKRR